MRTSALGAIYVLAGGMLCSGAVCAASSDGAAPARVRGTISRVDADAVTVITDAAQKVVVHVSSKARILAARKAALFDVTPGSYVGIVNIGPIGLQDALEVHIFPDEMRGASAGQQPWDIGRHSRLTTGTAGPRSESYDGQNVTLSYAGGESTIQVRPNTPVVRLMIGSAANLVPGAPVVVDASHESSDGSVTADEIIVGQDGARPGL